MAFDSARREDGPRTAAEGARYGQQLARRLLGNRHAFDEAPERDVARGNGDAVAKIAEWASLNLNDREMDELLAALGRDRADMSMDARRPSRGMSAGARTSFNEMFPGVARIKY